MKGFPKIINSRQDVLHLLADPATKPAMLAKLQTLLDERYNWVLQGKLDINATAPAEAGTKIVDVKNDDGVVSERYLYKWMIAPNSALARLGITAAEAVASGCVDNVIPTPAA
ncbi:hypothetical protein K9F62_03150 [Desulfovibrio sp. JY]|nr:hypothetical protein K9F62_03150 [Desulfovibrio sp. JY]